MNDDRIATLDALRGIALMGILVMNIAGFALPQAGYVNPDFTGPASTADRLLWTLGFVVVDGKARALFAALFGAGILLSIERAGARGEPPFAGHARRMIALFAIGALHFVLLWPGDILTHYAVVGLFAALAAPLPARAQLAGAALLLATSFAVEVGFAAELAAARAGDAEGWGFYNDFLGQPDAAARAAEAVAHRQSLWTTARERLDDYGWTILTGDAGLRLEAAGFALLGMAGVRPGLLDGADAARCRRIARIALPAGLAGSALLAAWCWIAAFDALVVASVVFAWSMPARVLTAVGLACALAPRLARIRPRRLEAAGRTALSNYLGASIAMAAIFEGWGLGLYDRLPRAGLVPVVVLLWAAMLAWPLPWRRRFALGPAEWLWRSLAAGRPLAFRKRLATASQ